jgi:methylmalonyl-CoA mutase N-terminal domain/subunit
MLCEATRKELAKIDELGGMVKAIELRYPQTEIERSAYRFQKDLERGKEIVVGVNQFQMDVAAPKVFQLDPAIEREQRKHLAAVRAARDANQVAAALDAVEATARTTNGLLDPMLAAVEAKASVGEICQRLRKVFGRYQEGRV